MEKQLSGDISANSQTCHRGRNHFITGHHLRICKATDPGPVSRGSFWCRSNREDASRTLLLFTGRLTGDVFACLIHHNSHHSADMCSAQLHSHARAPPPEIRAHSCLSAHTHVENTPLDAHMSWFFWLICVLFLFQPLPCWDLNHGPTSLMLPGADRRRRQQIIHCLFDLMFQRRTN